MSLLTFPNATATAGAGVNAVPIAGGDLTTVQPGMTVTFGSRGSLSGPAYIISAVAPNGTNGGTLTLADPLAAALNNAPFVVNTLAYNGGATSLANFLITRIINYLSTFLGIGTSLDSSSKVLKLEKASYGALSQVLWSIAGRKWFGWEQVNVGGLEKLKLRAYSDGTTPTDAVSIDGATGTVDQLAIGGANGGNTTRSATLKVQSGGSSNSPEAIALQGGASGAAESGPRITFTSAVTNPIQAAAAIGSANVFAGESAGEAADLVFFTNARLGAGAYSGLIGRWRVQSAGPFLPGADNAYTLGSAPLRVSSVYAGTGTI